MLGGAAVFAAGPPAWRRFLPALALWLLAFAAKIYFVFPAFVAAAWVFVCRSWRLGVLFGMTAGVALIGTILLLALLFPGWPVVVLGANLGATAFDAGHLLRQTRDWALFSLPLLAGAAALLPQLRARPPGFWAFAAFCGAAVLAASLGGHPGAHMTYFFHLLTPFAVVAVTAAAGPHALPRRAMAFAFPVAILLSAQWFPADPSTFAVAEADFATAASLIAQAHQPLATTEFAPLLLAAGHRAPENGHADYFPYALARPPPALLAPLFPPAPVLARQAALLTRPIEDGLAARRFDLVLTNRFGFGLIPRPLLEAHYRVVGELPVAMPWAAQAWTAEIWRPRDE
jgi:hypothetical protein